jgi:hypothetical protein
MPRSFGKAFELCGVDEPPELLLPVGFVEKLLELFFLHECISSES